VTDSATQPDQPEQVGEPTVGPADSAERPDKLDEELLAARIASPTTIPEPPIPQKHHRDVQGGVARASVFGASDGLVSNVSLILGVAGADPGSNVVRLAGIAGLIAGAVSMAAGEWVSMRAQTELFERELALERRQLEKQPYVETVELAQIYMSRGVDPDTSLRLATELMSDPERALETHAREELGIDPSSLGSPVGAAVGSFFAFSAGAVIPLLPWFVSDGRSAAIASVVLGVLAAAIIGVALATFTGKSKLFSAIRQVAIATLAAGVTYGIGSLVGVDGGS
jgi:vacuolar iron transporter family protein